MLPRRNFLTLRILLLFSISASAFNFEFFKQTPVAREGVVRLSGSGSSWEGRVEIYHDGQWGTVCDDGWDMAEAQVVCRQLNFPGARSVVIGKNYEQASGPIWLDEVKCDGTEMSLFACNMENWGVTDCTHKEDVGVICQPPNTNGTIWNFPHSLDHSISLSDDLGSLFDSRTGCNFLIVVQSSTVAVATIRTSRERLMTAMRTCRTSARREMGRIRSRLVERRSNLQTRRRLLLQARKLLQVRRRALICHFYQSGCVPRRVWKNIRTSDWWDAVVSTYDDGKWMKDFRVSKDTFEYLCYRLGPELEKSDTNYRLCVPLRKRVAVALWKLATNNEYRSISHLFGIGISTVCHCVHNFCTAVEKVLLAEVIRLPCKNKLEDMAAHFQTKWGLPQCVGAIDGSHIPIIRPEEYHTEYFNRKGWHSIILQAVVDAKGLFWNVFVGAGSLHDARVLRLSGLWDLVDRGLLHSQETKNIHGHNVGYYLLGDAAYPLKSWLLKPFNDNGRLTMQQLIYNNKTSRARITVEHAFGRLKGRWRCLLNRNDCQLDKVKSMVITCCVLHNLCEQNGDDFLGEWEDSAIVPQQPDGTESAIVETEGVHARAAILKFLNTSL
ncbi:uncharacterized protein LOC144022774 isoform X2 [Festucalex cinctus]